MEAQMKRLTRSPRDRVLGGICGGIGEYLAWDPVLVRLLFIGLALISGGIGVILYLIAWIIVPLRDERLTDDTENSIPKSGTGRTVVGIFLIIAGALAILTSVFPWFWGWPSFRLVGPLLLVAVGIAVLLWKRNGQREASPETPGEPDSGVEPAPDRSRMSSRRLYRSYRGRKLAGVCAGLGEYFQVDPVIIRLLWVALVLAAGTGILLYIIFWIVTPLEKNLPVTQQGAA